MKEKWEPEEYVVGVASKVFSEEDLPGSDRGGHEWFSCADAFFLGKEFHGDEGEEENEEEWKDILAKLLGEEVY